MKTSGGYIHYLDLYVCTKGHKICQNAPANANMCSERYNSGTCACDIVCDMWCVYIKLILNESLC